MVTKQEILVLDVHDGAGKTTLANLLAEKVSGEYVKPFNNSLGDMIAWLYKNQKYALTDTVSRLAIEKVYDENKYDENKNVNCLIFDRHWLSIFTLLPEKYFSNWGKLPKTFLCWVDVETTIQRLTERGETILENDRHEYYCSQYKKLAERFGVPLIDTNKYNIDESLEKILAKI